MRKHLLLPAIALMSMGQTKVPEEMYISVPHGSFPKLTKYQWEGTLPRTGDQVGATFSLQQHGWDVTVTRGARPPVRFLLRAKRSANAHPDRALLWVSGNEHDLHLDIPYGEPQEDCFANGSDVFESVQINIMRNGQFVVQETRFNNCQAQHEDLEIAQQNGAIVIAD